MNILLDIKHIYRCSCITKDFKNYLEDKNTESVTKILDENGSTIIEETDDSELNIDLIKNNDKIVKF